jgi:hypothetical protein
MTIVRRLSPTGDMMFGQGLANYARRAEACAQNVRTRLRLVLGEWFLDDDAGVPYLEQVFAPRVPLATVEAVLKGIILATTDVQAVLAFTMSLDRATRILAIATTVATIYGETINIQVTT